MAPDDDSQPLVDDEGVRPCASDILVASSGAAPNRAGSSGNTARV
jgi:hypothetical protein